MTDKIIRNPEAAAYEKIRKYVVGQIAKSGKSPMRLASNREIAQKFGVSHPTVIKALKDLVDDGLLNIKPGVGTFTNPGRIAESNKNLKVTGILMNEGKAAYTTSLFINISHRFIYPLVQSSKDYQVQNIFLTGKASQIPKEIKESGLDAIIWFSPLDNVVEAIKTLKDSGMPIVSLGRDIPGVTSTYFDFETDNYNVAKKMIEEGRKKIFLFILANTNLKEEAIRGFKRAFKEKKLSCPDSYIYNVDSKEDPELTAALMAGAKPEGIIFNNNLNPYLPVLRKHLDIINECRLYSGAFSIQRDMNYHGYAGYPHITDEGEKIASNLIEQMKNPSSAEVLRIPIPLKIKSYDIESEK